MVLASDFSWKDAHPLDTVKRIKDILVEQGIQTVEKWYESSVPNCFSLRVTIAGTVFGTNGKGITKELALASAYGEFMERIQLGHIWRSKLNVENGASSSELQSRLIPADTLVQKKSPWHDTYVRVLKEHTGLDLSPEEMLRQYADKDNNIRVTPFYCLTTHTMEFLPTTLCNIVYHTNGGAAGNTPEEALVQAISEIVERNHQMRIISGGIPVPDVPEDVLQSFPIAYEIIQHLRKNGFRAIVKDCSLGTAFPVICVCLINTATGQYHTHFGAHPNFEIALQRTLTESFQGRNLSNVCKHIDFCDNANEIMEMKHLSRELTYGTSEKPAQFFLDLQEPYKKVSGLNGSNNRETLRECIAFFKKQGYDVLVRDSSCLGFPTYQVIIPGYSDIFPHRLSVKHNDMRNALSVNKVLQNPASAKLNDLVSFMMHFAESKRQNGADMKQFLLETGIPASLTSDEQAVFMFAAFAHVSYSLGKNAAALKYVDSVLTFCREEEMEYLVCVKRYLSMLCSQFDSEKIKTVLKRLHKEETVEKLYSYIDSSRNIIDPVVLQCDYQCREDCKLYSKCQKSAIPQLIHRVGQKASEMDPSVMEAQFCSI